MKITVLGTGDTVGTPRVGCECPVCTWAVREGRERLRTSFLIEEDGHNILIDTSPDLRRQLLKHGSPYIDAILWTHGHYDHIAGYNEFYRVQSFPPAYAASRAMDDIEGFFHFLHFERKRCTPYQPFEIYGIKFTFAEVNHPPMYTCGVVMEYNGKKIGFTSDTNDDLCEETLKALSGCDLLFIDALMPPSVHIGKHMNYKEALNLAEKLSAKKYYMVHMSHNLPFNWKHMASDGEVFEI
ncbi:phosphoribosyl 1,2-cyclic phosphate phosphodiesterase [Methanomicrobium sp. W14]|uniref:MBL fold metallo-hydrolase n=1 Tax=Methanomicrobium sp. W14 TaxID=2817839 RepID=UPI001AE1B3AE|nr:MBL fold metallo-hydrolase [Methanomicrobium sp. W14]MBP2133801.1 phosphoribosyl 1,2-cyclic phosphate phosphodiesterase [Methanomicrobium sp. W14]